MEVQLRSVPPYVVAIIWSIFISVRRPCCLQSLHLMLILWVFLLKYYCMKTKRHGLFILISITPSNVGFVPPHLDELARR